MCFLWARLRPIDHNYQVVIRKSDQKVFTQSVALVIVKAINPNEYNVE